MAKVAAARVRAAALGPSRSAKVCLNTTFSVRPLNAAASTCSGLGFVKRDFSACLAWRGLRSQIVELERNPAIRQINPERRGAAKGIRAKQFLGV